MSICKYVVTDQDSATYRGEGLRDGVSVKRSVEPEAKVARRPVGQMADGALEIYGDFKVHR